MENTNKEYDKSSLLYKLISLINALKLLLGFASYFKYKEAAEEIERDIKSLERLQTELKSALESVKSNNNSNTNETLKRLHNEALNLKKGIEEYRESMSNNGIIIVDIPKKSDSNSKVDKYFQLQHNIFLINKKLGQNNELEDEARFSDMSHKMFFQGNKEKLEGQLVKLHESMSENEKAIVSYAKYKNGKIHVNVFEILDSLVSDCDKIANQIQSVNPSLELVGKGLTKDKSKKLKRPSDSSSIAVY